VRPTRKVHSKKLNPFVGFLLRYDWTCERKLINEIGFMKDHRPLSSTLPTAEYGLLKLVYLAAGALVITLAACAAEPELAGVTEVTSDTALAVPMPAQSGAIPERVAHGQYLVGLLGCATCHTDGALVGEPSPERLLAGSSVGIAWSDPLVTKLPGVVFPANLTPDKETGIGNWTVGDLVRVLRSGVDRGGRQHLPVMPWPAYAHLTDNDAAAIAAYLLSLPPVRHRVPANVSPGQRTDTSYVHFGVYRKK